jgi:hypothetical protein
VIREVIPLINKVSSMSHNYEIREVIPLIKQEGHDGPESLT